MAQGLLTDIMTSENLTKAYHQPIEVKQRTAAGFAAVFAAVGLTGAGLDKVLKVPI